MRLVRRNSHSDKIHSPAQRRTCVWYGLLFFSVFSILGCKKEKADFSFDNRPDIIENSNIRIVNLGDYRHLEANGKSLTYDGEPWWNGNPPTEYFPDYPGGLMRTHTPWFVPKELFDGKQFVDLRLTDENGSSIHFNMPAPSNVPLDYYTLRTEGEGQPWAVAIPRDEDPPSKPDHFKIRIVNLAKLLPQLQVPSPFGALENLYSKITLAYADGTPVSPQTTNIDLGQRVSEYVEIPYGTYQFRILTEDGRQISAMVHGVNSERVPLRTLNPATSQIDFALNFAPTHSPATYSPLQTYNPGGVYTLVVAPQRFLYYLSASTVNRFGIGVQNQFKIIVDQLPKPNHEFAKIQAVNAAPRTNVSFRINGRNIGNLLKFSDFTDSHVFKITDSIVCEVIDLKGNILINERVPIRPNQNISLWFWKNGEGLFEVVPVYNDLNPDRYEPFGSDFGMYNRFEMTSYTGIRFLNLCPDVENLNFTMQNGEQIFDLLSPDPGGTSNILKKSQKPEDIYYFLKPGTPKTTWPYLFWQETTSLVMPFQILAFQTSSSLTPGTWLDKVEGLSHQVFVANPQLYHRVGREVPAFQDGVYTVALVGRNVDGAHEDEKARIIAIKHTN